MTDYLTGIDPVTAVPTAGDRDVIVDVDPGGLFGHGAAVFDPSRTYRYALTRRWLPDKPAVAWLMLNPSTADAFSEDATSRRVRGFTERLGAGAFVVVNLFALRSTDPRAVPRHPDPVGPLNDQYLREVLAATDGLIVAWGFHRWARGRVHEVVPIIFDSGNTAYCLGRAKDGNPRHPLYLPGDAKPERWPN
jgi:hypothetical protein